MRSEHSGVVRTEDVYDTDPQDLWQACTDPDRLARWIATVSGDTRVGGMVQLAFTSSWAGLARVEQCEPPRHLLLTTEPGGDEEGEIEAWLTPEGTGTRLVVEDRGLPNAQLPAHEAGWRAHLEDLATALETGEPVHPGGWTPERPADGWLARWRELSGRTPAS